MIKEGLVIAVEQKILLEAKTDGVLLKTNAILIIIFIRAQ